MILLIDNYDSFTYNLFQYIAEFNKEVIVKRNDEVTLSEIRNLEPEAIVLSPGPGRPVQAGICLELIKEFYREIPILGICLGHQAIGEAFGAEVSIAAEPKHGKTSLIKHTGLGIFEYLPQPIEVMRYHSLVLAKNSIPKCLTVAASAMDDSEIMAVQHVLYPIFGVQFHPESIGTKTGKKLIKNFIELVERMVGRNEEISAKIG
ncbi:anthranilate synthase component II [Falsibacillus pallidus]|uniref:Anthranilate synthase component II n=1 Tax=Falsibacillus pallidus TaxID=493781 RepID=A0A370GH68_9BACI|nr:aminodeoxychorismate/anthranilate synthase component II [Falsibacillus pallidus]RDI43148.1 anthranilate synthase component II [Falsibacillus pallidus]